MPDRNSIIQIDPKRAERGTTMEKVMTIKEAWRHCYAAAREAARHYQTGLYYAEIAKIDSAAYYFMLASNDVKEAHTGYRITGSIYTSFSACGFIFNAYTHDDDSGIAKYHTFEFKFGESIPENKHASDNRREWQRQAQTVEHIVEMHNTKRDIARLLNGMTDEDFFKAYDAIKRIAKSTR